MCLLIGTVSRVSDVAHGPPVSKIIFFYLESSHSDIINTFTDISVQYIIKVMDLLL